ncbi:hypothetical protein ACFWGP_05630 [Agromyces sp. NPDC127015]|uniref:hypothetical protein n=1 Tax=Agromyces sp. NPDC127015 TaxID=3347108 RepID=UPI0036596F1E
MEHAINDRLLKKNPSRWLEHELRDIGFHPVNHTDKLGRDHDKAKRYRHDNGSTIGIPQKVSAGLAVSLAGEWRRKLGIPRESAATPPTLERGKVKVSQHARERLELMRQQAAVGGPEIEATLFYATNVEWDRASCAWRFEVGRIAAMVAVTPDGTAVVKTFLWTREELFEQHPRPEKEAPHHRGPRGFSQVHAVMDEVAHV